MNEMKSYRAKERTEMEVHTTTLLFQAPKNSFWELRSHSKKKRKTKIHSPVIVKTRLTKWGHEMHMKMCQNRMIVISMLNKNLK